MVIHCDNGVDGAVCSSWAGRRVRRGETPSWRGGLSSLTAVPAGCPSAWWPCVTPPAPSTATSTAGPAGCCSGSARWVACWAGPGGWATEARPSGWATGLSQVGGLLGQVGGLLRLGQVGGLLGQVGGLLRLGQVGGLLGQVSRLLRLGQVGGLLGWARWVGCWARWVGYWGSARWVGCWARWVGYWGSARWVACWAGPGGWAAGPGGWPAGLGQVGGLLGWARWVDEIFAIWRSAIKKSAAWKFRK